MSYAKNYKLLLVVALLALFTTTIIQAIIPRVAKYFIDNFIGKNFAFKNTVVMILVAYYLLYLLQALFNYIGKTTFARVSFGIVRDLRNDAFANIQKLGISYFDKVATGSVVSRITNDTEAISNIFGVIFSSFIRGTFLIFVSLYSIFTLNVQLGFLMLLLMPIIFACMYYYRKLAVSAVAITRSKLSTINAKLAESVDGMRIIQSFRQEERLIRDFEKTNAEHNDYYIKYLKIDSLLLRPALSLLKIVAYAILLMYFGFRGEYLGFTAGIMYALIQYVNRLFDPLIELTQSFSSLQMSVVSAERVFDVVDENNYEPKQFDKDIKIEEGNIEFKNISFSYDGQHDILKNISFKANKGETIAFVGHTGSGKSSIINLFMRFYEFDRGQILIDGHDIKSFKRDELLKKVGLVLQDPFLYHGDIESNIKLFAENLTKEEVIQAAKFVDAHNFIAEFEDGYKHKVTERGSTLSSGQRQLIAFARTIALAPKILILDEATANIDSETEELIQKSLKKMRKGRTTIAIAHRLSTIQDANCIYVLDKGKIIESGCHEELLAKQGTYYKMYQLQTGMM
ncbi:ABC transporter ATP-binding protein/permease [Gemella sp. zg-570]|uniref:ABC transporter ATP-binding protein n=1 Tax=Gemella sp. zg-570 TaxID=2840371 RepID=UPI001C0B05A7|nr:ABC transporter ATP-binding protein [Gemella sp. zg-570]QWQ39544.1 ABC transporter ATP-binding protein/permease [Gemella sp. zg-570]